MNNGYLKNKTAVVTGAARNLGRGIAEMLAAHGANVVVHYRSAASKVDAEETARRVLAKGVQVELVEADLENAEQTRTLVDRAVQRFGSLDVLVNNAGMILKKPIGQLSLEQFDRIFAVNARAPFVAMKVAAEKMANGGRIVNIGTSILGASIPQYGLYAGSKAALEHMTRDFALQFRARGITVNTVAPGALETPFFHAAETPESVAGIKHWAGGLGSVDDVVPLVEFLCSPGAKWLTGQTLFINGGVVTR